MKWLYRSSTSNAVCAEILRGRNFLDICNQISAHKNFFLRKFFAGKLRKLSALLSSRVASKSTELTPLCPRNTKQTVEIYCCLFVKRPTINSLFVTVTVNGSVSMLPGIAVYCEQQEFIYSCEQL